MRNRHLVLAALICSVPCTLATAQKEQHHLFTFTGDAATDDFGLAVSGIGDVDKDGFGDVCVGADQANQAAGYVRFFSGATGRVLATVTGTAAGDALGRTVAAAGDVNKDSWPDVVIGASGTSATPGYAIVVSGLWLQTGGGTRVLWTFNGATAGDQYGFSVSGAGDVDKDGNADLLIGARQNGTGTGYAEVRSGRTGAVLHTFPGGVGIANFGQTVAGAGDTNADGYPDVVIGGGFVFRVYSGKDGSQLTEVRNKGGKAVSGAHDVNNDGFDDVMVFDGNTGTPKSVHVFSGKDWTVLFTLPAGSASPHTTYMSELGDINGDQFADVLVHNGGSTAYPVSVYSGKDGTPLLQFTGPAGFGHSVRSAGDIDGDKVPDFVIGEPAAATGAAHVFSSRKLVLASDVHAVSLSQGGTQKLSVDAGTPHAGRSYWLFGSITGTSPGTNLLGVHIPLNVDVYTNLAFASTNLGPFVGFRGTLDPNGRGAASLVIPNGLPSTPVVLHHACVVFDAQGVYLSSGAVPISLR